MGLIQKGQSGRTVWREMLTLPGAAGRLRPLLRGALLMALPDVRRSFEKVLSQDGYYVTSAAGGREALVLSRDSVFDLVVWI